MNKKIRVTKIFSFEMAHALLGYDGLCNNIHGHSYKLHVTVEGYPIDDEKNPKNGMVIDFYDLKKLITDSIIKKYDHSLVLNKKSPKTLIKILKKSYKRVTLEPYQPTSENLVFNFAKVISKILPKGVKLVNLKLYETENAYAEWIN